MYVKPGRVAVPPNVVTTISPDAPSPTMAVIRVDEFTVPEEDATPPKLTDGYPKKSVPNMVTAVPFVPDKGLNDWIVGGVYWKVKDSIEVASPVEV